MPLSKNKSRQIAIKNILARYKDQLLAIENVVDVGVGFSIENKRLTDELSIIVEVPQKVHPDDLSEAQILPRQIEGIRVDIINSPTPENLLTPINPIHPKIQETSTSRNHKYRQLIGGIRIRNGRHKNLGGTLGAIVYDRTTNEPFGITSRHVLISDSPFSMRNQYPVIQPNIKWRSDTEIGEVLKDGNIELDCIRFQLNGKREIYKEASLLGIAGKIQGIESDIVCGTKVMKSGARTGVTYGVIISESICRENFVVYPDNDYLLIDGELTLAGDSGSIWVTNDDGPMKAIGLHIMGNKCNQYDAELAVAIKIDKVAEFLNIKF